MADDKTDEQKAAEQAAADAQKPVVEQNDALGGVGGDSKSDVPAEVPSNVTTYDPTDTDVASAADVRRWAKDNGYNDVKSRGRIANDIVAAFRANTHRQTQDDLDGE